MTEGDRMLIREINRALVTHPFVCPLPISLGGGMVEVSRAAARSLATRLEQQARAERNVAVRRAALEVVA